jgi:hypothetical protein
VLARHMTRKIYEAVNLPVVMFGRGTWSLVLREGKSLTAFEDK